MDREADLIQSLKDSGCDDETVNRINSLYQAGYIDDAIRGLRSFRGGLMDQLHKSQAKVDCLDFLVYRMQKEVKKTSVK